MIKLADTLYFKKFEKFLAYYLKNGAYYMNNFHFEYEIERMKFN